MRQSLATGCQTAAPRRSTLGVPDPTVITAGPCAMPSKDQFLNRLRKKAKKGMRGWPVATIAFYGPNLEHATKVAVGIVPFEDAEVKIIRDWKSDRNDVRTDPGIAQEILEFIEEHGVLSVAMSGIIGCPHQEGIDYEGEWCPVCEFWRGRDRFTGQMVQPFD